MHRPFKYISSPIQQLHEHVAEIVGIWCDAAGAFSVDLIQDAVLKDLVGRIEVRNQKWQQVIADINELFRQLTPAERETIREGFIQNNRIEELCNKTADPVHYSDLPELVRQPLKYFFTELYTDVLNRKPFIDAYKTTTKDYFDKLIEASNLTVCPFCGMNSLKSRYHDGRDAFDHFLPKGTYPFNAINFKNLAPICHECNSDEKLAKDPLFGGAGKTGRRIATYPFSNEVTAMTVSVQFTTDLNAILIASLEPQQFEVNLTCADVEATSTWDAVFDIRKRYNAKICQKMKEWLQDLLKQYRRRQGRGESLEQFMDDKLDDYRDMPLLDKNFLRNAIFSRLREDGILLASMQEMLANT